MLLTLRKNYFYLGIVLSVFMSGCATVTGSSTQQVLVDVRDQKNRAIEGVSCKLSNDKGTWYTNSPNPATVQKSSRDLYIVTNKDGYLPGTAKLVSKVNAGMFGNIILGGGVGAVIDHAKGTAYDYPNMITVMMEEDRSKFKNKRNSARDFD